MARLAFGAGDMLVTASEDGTANVWDFSSGALRTTFLGHSAVLNHIAVNSASPSARTDGTVALHLLPLDEFVELARKRVTRGLTDQKCRDYLHLEACR